MSFKRSIVSLGFLAVALASSAARATDCKVATDCPKGFICELNAPSTPPSEPAPAPTCAPGTICPVADPAPTPTFAAPKPATTGYCLEAPCTADADCGTGMVCHTDTISACSGGSVGACAANTDCGATKVAPPSDPVCTETKVSTCMFKWQLPCSADTDCGAGFTCTPTGGVCSGGSGTSGSGVATPGTTTSVPGGATSSNTSAAAVAPVPPDTTCTPPTFPGYCAPKATTCMTNTDCPSMWTCQAFPTRTDPATTVGSGPAASSGAAGGSGTTNGATAADVAVPPTGTTPTLVPPPASSTMCVSPFGIYAAQDANGTPTVGTPGSSGSGTGGTTGSVQVPPMVPGGAKSESAAPSAGCAVGGSSSGSPFALLLLGALGLLVARRRR